MVDDGLYYDCYEYAISYDTAGGMIVNITDTVTGVRIVANPGDDINYNSENQCYTITHINGSKEYYDPFTGEYVYRSADGSGNLVANGKETYFGSGQIYLNPDGTVIVPQYYIYEATHDSFILTTDPNFETVQRGADDPTTGVNSDNSTLVHEATCVINGIGDVNKDGGIISEANSILSDNWRPGANEIVPKGFFEIGDFSYTAVQRALRGDEYAGSFVNQYTSYTNLRIPVDPLVLDLNGDGVKLVSFGEVPVLFDIDHDGKKELTGWATVADGIVVMDLNGNGIIDGIHETMSEYFTGTVGTDGEPGSKPYVNGFAALKSLDSNGDNRFTIADTAWSSVKVWTDADHDGETDAGELKTLAELGITSINLTSTTQSGLVNGGNEILATGTFVQNGVTKEAQAARFIANPVGNTATTSGTGTIVAAEDGQSTYVSSLTTGETIDVAAKGVKNAYGNTGNDNLIGDGNANWLVGSTGSDTFSGGAGDDMLIIDASDLQQNIHAGDGFDMLQVVGSEGVTLNMTRAEVEVAVGGSGNDVIIGGGRSSVFVRAGDGDDIVIGGAANDALSGQNGVDMIDGGAGNDVIRGGRGQDMLMGGAGDDLVEGGVDDDQISGGTGNDVLKGGQGDDVVDGGEGTDIAEFSGSFADYRITKLTDNSYRIVDTKAGRDGADMLTNVEKLNFADVSAVDITLDNPMLVKDVLTIADRSGVKLIRVSDLLANDRDWQGDALHITTISDIKGGSIAGSYNSSTNEWTPTLTANGELQFTPDPSYTGVMSFKYKIADVDGTPGATAFIAGTSIQAEMRGQVYLKTPDMPTDSLFADEWYLNEINVLPVWAEYTGKGVRIGQFEPGMPFSIGAEVFDYRHADLQDNVDSSWFADPNADIPQSFSQHATLVAGVMVGARDGEGAVGVAYDASLAGYYVGGTLTQDLPDALKVDFSSLYRLKNYDVSNNSWGYSPQFEYFTKSVPNLPNEFFKPAVALGRYGLGSNIVMAGGNSRQSGGNTNSSELTANRYVIVTGAINAESDISTLTIGHAPFSNSGASILVSAPGSNVTSTSSILMNDDGTIFGNDTATAQGTSFATPIVTGVIALMLEANPNLGYRDVQQILALSAKMVNDPNTDNTYNGATNWNGGGMHLSHDYGFGEVDARAAVRLAESWFSQHTSFNERHLSNGEGSLAGGANLGVAIADAATVTRTVSLGGGLRAEHVELTLDITHNNYNDLTVELISPTGTVSKLIANPGTGPVSNPDMQMRQLTFTFDTTHDWGENVEGNWQLRIIDRAGLGNGMLNGWTVDAYGSDLNETIATSTNVGGPVPVNSVTADSVYYFTDEFASAPGATRTIINDTNGGLDLINAVAVSTGSTINLNNGAVSTIAGRNLTINGTIEFAFGGDGNDTITGSDLANRLFGERGNDVMSGGGGMDLMDGGAGNDSLTGGAGYDYFIIHPIANSVDTITDFTPGTLGEKILLVGFDNVTDYSQMTVTQEGVNTRLNLGNAQSVLLQNLTPSQISEQNFGFFSDTMTLEKYAWYVSNIPLSGGTSGVESGLLPSNLGDMRYFALGGADAIGATTTNDLIDGGDGNDTIWGDYPGYTVSPGADWLEGGSGNDTLSGGPGNDLLLGGSGSDNLRGEVDDDVLRGATGADVLLGGDGNDLLLGGAGDDYMEGGAGNDVLYLEGDWGTVNGTNFSYYGTRVGGAGADTFVVTPNGGGTLGFMASGTQFSAYNLIADFDPNQAGELIDLSNLTWIRGYIDLSLMNLIVMGTAFTRVSASSGTNQLVINLRGVSSNSLNASHFRFNSNPGLVFGTAGNDTLTGDAGGNTLDGGVGVDIMTGRTGDDTYIVDNAGDLVNELPDGGFDTVQTSVTYVLAANVENLELTGTGAINGTGNEQGNLISGNAADSVLDGRAGADTMLGGLGNDTYVVDNQSDTVIEHVGEGTDTVQSSVSYTLGNEIENLTLTGTEAINATCNNLANTLTGNAGSNILDGAGGADTMSGGAGDDTYLVELAGDVVVENVDEGYDTVYASVNYTLGANVENLVLGAGVISGNGNDLDNWLQGNALSNTLTGGAGNDILDGGSGADSMVGGTGDDTYVVDHVGDVVTEHAGEGVDTIYASISIDLSAKPNVENVELTGSDNLNVTGNGVANELYGNSGSNVLIGGAGNDILDGGEGLDVMMGGTNDDTYVVDSTGDVVTEQAGEGVDSVYASINYALGINVDNLLLTGYENLTGTGNSNNNVLTGNVGNNSLDGGTGNDTLAGSYGDDTLVGGIRDDTYLFDSGGGEDTIRENDATSGNLDKLVFGDLITPDQVTVTRDGMDLVLSLTEQDQVRSEGWFADDAHKVEQVVFSNGTVWSVGDLMLQANNAPTGTVTVSGTATQGQVLTAGNTLADADGLGVIGYQWQSSGDGVTWTNIAGATASTYTLTQVQVGWKIRAMASYTDGFGTVESVSSVGTATVANVNDAPTGTVTVSGTATQGQVLMASNTLGDADGLGTIGYQWQSSNDGVTWTNIEGSTSASYMLTQSEVGRKIRAMASYTDGFGTHESVGSVATATVANVNDEPTGTVTVSGTSTQGQVLAASNTLSDADGLGTIGYQWQTSIDGVAWTDIAGATTESYMLTQTEVGRQVRAVANYTDGFGMEESVSSTATAAVANVNDLPGGTVIVSGTARQGQVLTAGHTLSDADGLGDIGYQWQSSDDGVTWSDISGATASSYTLTQLEVGKKIRALASYTDGYGSLELVSSVATAAVANVNDAPTGVVTVNGTVTQGQVLTAGNSLSDADGLGTISYQWQSSSDGVAWTDIAGATASSYTLTQSEVGRKVRAVANYTDGFGTLESVSAAATASVEGTNNAPVVATAISAQNATEDAVFSFMVPSNTFDDVDAGDTLTFSATRSDGTALPAWLSFDAATRMFTGTPTSISAGTISLRVTVSDRAGATASTNFVLTIANHIVGISSINNLNGTDFNDYMEGLGSINTMKGGLGNDTVIANRTGSINYLYGDAGSDSLDANGSINYLYGGEGNDNVRAVGSINYLYGDAGSDLLDANGSINYLYGGEGNDNVRAVGSINYLYGDAGSDSLDANGSINYLYGGESNDDLHATGSINYLYGGDGNDSLDVNGSINYLYGGTGDDTYIVRNGSDRVVENANEGTDLVQSSVTVTLAGNVENLTLTGSAAINGTGNLLDNAIKGNAANNTLNGGDGNDTLDGGVGNDTLNGGLGNDLYRFARGGGQDVISETDSTVGNSDLLAFESDVAYDQLWFRHVGNDLVVNIIGGTDTVAIRNWYAGSANHVEQIRAGDGKVLTDANVNALVQAMSTLSTPMAGQTVLPTATQAQLAPVLAANWY